MKISIVVPIYNCENYLEECLESISSQTYRNIEVLCVNDGSTDKSEKVIDKYIELDYRFKKINKPNGGLSSARNLGMKQATGDYLMFVDSDDYIDKNACLLVAQEISKQGNPDTVIFDCQLFDNSTGKKLWVFWSIENHQKMACLNEAKYPSGIFSLNDYDYQLSPSMCFKAFRKGFIDEMGLSCDEKVKYGEDFAFLSDLIWCNPKCVILEKPLYFYRKNQKSSMTTDIQHDMDKILGYFEMMSQKLTKLSDNLSRKALMKFVWRILTEFNYYVQFDNSKNILKKWIVKQFSTIQSEMKVDVLGMVKKSKFQNLKKAI